MLVAHKNIGETPLECLERSRLENVIAFDVPMTYAGRLDPLASGKLLMLVGNECKNKEKYLGLDKEYEIEVVFGIKTDTGDMLGLVDVDNVYTLSTDPKKDLPRTGASHDLLSKIGSWTKLCGKFSQEYPAYSSKTIGGRQLHSLARSGKLPDEMPTKNVEIYSIEELEKSEISGHDIAAQAVQNVSRVNGDFRQKEILESWKRFEREYGSADFLALKLRVKCSSGTYMRSLAERIGNEAGTTAFAFSIERTKVGEF